MQNTALRGLSSQFVVPIGSRRYRPTCLVGNVVPEAQRERGDDDLERETGKPLTRTDRLP
jgi:hypothetical protein